jgi:hypothetical protein
MKTREKIAIGILLVIGVYAIFLMSSCAAREEKDENNVVYINLDGSSVTCRNGACERTETTIPSRPRPVPIYTPLPDSPGASTPVPGHVTHTSPTNVNVTVTSTATNTNNIDISQCQKNYQFQEQSFSCTVACPPTPQQPVPPTPCTDRGKWKPRYPNPVQRPPATVDLTYESFNCGLPYFEVLTY